MNSGVTVTSITAAAAKSATAKSVRKLASLKDLFILCRKFLGSAL